MFIVKYVLHSLWSNITGNINGGLKPVQWIADRRVQLAGHFENNTLNVENLFDQLNRIDVNSEFVQSDMNDVIENLNNIYTNSARESFGNQNRSRILDEKHIMPWFHGKCDEKRKENYDKNRTPENRQLLKVASAAYRANK